jgi:septal ring factor EnvC (AmiA/AmiB activator)
VTNVNGTVDALREPILRDVAELERTIRQARSLMASVESLIRANDQEVADTMQNVRAASQDLKELAESLKQRPWSLIRIKQPDDRKVPK